jgi:hypothetical protein
MVKIRGLAANLPDGQMYDVRWPTAKKLVNPGRGAKGRRVRKRSENPALRRGGLRPPFPIVGFDSTSCNANPDVL